MITRVSFKHWSMTCACYSSSQHKPSLSLLVDLTAGHKSFSCYSYVLCPCPSSGNSIIMSSTLLSIFFYRSCGEFFNFLFNSKSLQERNTEKVQKFSAHIFKYINYSSILASLTISDGKEVPSLMHS